MVFSNFLYYQWNITIFHNIDMLSKVALNFSMIHDTCNCNEYCGQGRLRTHLQIITIDRVPRFSPARGIALRSTGR